MGMAKKFADASLLAEVEGLAPRVDGLQPLFACGTDAFACIPGLGPRQIVHMHSYPSRCMLGPQHGWRLERLLPLGRGYPTDYVAGWQFCFLERDLCQSHAAHATGVQMGLSLGGKTASTPAILAILQGQTTCPLLNVMVCLHIPVVHQPWEVPWLIGFQCIFVGRPGIAVCGAELEARLRIQLGWSSARYHLLAFRCEGDAHQTSARPSQHSVSGDEVHATTHSHASPRP